MKIKFKDPNLSETERLRILLKEFSKIQEFELVNKLCEGYVGWDDKKQMKEELIKRIIDNLFGGDWIDVANLVMFAWNLDLKPWQCMERRVK